MVLSLSRRDLLAALLGAGAAATVSCRSKKETPIEWDGGFVGPSHEAGHRLRDGLAGIPGDLEAEEIPVLILGAGVSGLAAGWQLARAGRTRFEIVELEPAAGGTAASGEMGGLRHPWGAHYLPAPDASNADLLELLAETGSLVDRGGPNGAPRYEETHLCATPVERVYHQGFWHEGLYPTVGASAADLEQLARFHAEIDRLLAFRDADGRRAFSLPMHLSSDAEEIAALDRISMDEWLRKLAFDSPRLRWYVEYACRDDYGAELGETSAWAGLFYFAARRTTPAGSGEDDSAEYLTWPEGNGFLIDRMLARIGRERLITGELVARVGPAPDGRRARVVTVSVATGKARAFIAERVIFALPSYLRRYLIAPCPADAAYHPSYAPWLVANLHLRERPASRGYPQAWDNVIYGSRSLGYVVATHQLHRDRGPTVWTYYLPLSAPGEVERRKELLSLSWKEACDAIVTELAGCHLELPRAVARIDAMRWGHGMVRPTVGSIFSRERSGAQTPLGAIHFAHADLSGMALFEEAFFHGTRAAREVLAAIG